MALASPQSPSRSRLPNYLVLADQASRLEARLETPVIRRGRGGLTAAATQFEDHYPLEVGNRLDGILLFHLERDTIDTLDDTWRR
jgi:hypothetical protein